MHTHLYTLLQASVRRACLRSPTTTHPKCSLSPSHRPLPHMSRQIHNLVKCLSHCQWQCQSPRAGRPAWTRLGVHTTRTT